MQEARQPTRRPRPRRRGDERRSEGDRCVGNPSGYVVFIGGLTLAFAGGLSFLLASEFESLRDEIRATDAPDVEAKWAQAARNERSKRRTAAVLGYVSAAAFVGLGTWELLSAPARGAGRPARESSAALFLGFAATDILLATAMLAVDGPIETSLRSYERSTGRELKPEARFRIAPTSGGVIAGVGGTF